MKKKHKKVWVELYPRREHADFSITRSGPRNFDFESKGEFNPDDFEIIYREEDSDALKKLKELREKDDGPMIDCPFSDEFNFYEATDEDLYTILDALGID